VVKEQIVLSENGISMEYTDTIDSQSRYDLLQFMSEWREEHPLIPKL